ncbi:MAG: hypothetical protein SO414_06945, partial [Bacteroidaceae bacterium]|nr:hypothetical protein [Bacteroidaceae bacterium]
MDVLFISFSLIFVTSTHYFMAHRKTMGEGIPKCAFSRKRLRERFITFASAVYNVCIRGCKRYPWRTHVFAFKVDQIGPG